MKYVLLITAVFCLTICAAAEIAAKVNPSLVAPIVLEQLNNMLIVGLACLAGYSLYNVEEMLSVNEEV